MTSQDGQDIFVLRTLDDKQNGFFVEIGAWDGIEFSNTYLLEKRHGWTGLLAEADPNALEKLKHNRPDALIDGRAVWRESGNKIEFLISPSGKLSGIKDNITFDKTIKRGGTIQLIPTVTLDDLLDAHNCPQHIDYMSIDTEGSEYEIISAYSFSRTFGVITIEHLNNKDKIISLMDEKGYKIARTFIQNFETAFIPKNKNLTI